MKELKARCRGFAEIEQKLRKMEARKVFEGKESATYFETEGRGALKIVEAEKEGGFGLAAYNGETGCFDIIYTPILEPNGVRRIFNKLFGSIAKIELEKKVFLLGPFEVWLVHIDRLGNFVIIRGENEEKMHEMLERLGLDSENVVDKDFGQLLTHSEEKIS